MVSKGYSSQIYRNNLADVQVMALTFSPDYYLPELQAYTRSKERVYTLPRKSQFEVDLLEVSQFFSFTRSLFIPIGNRPARVSPHVGAEKGVLQQSTAAVRVRFRLGFYANIVLGDATCHTTAKLLVAMPYSARKTALHFSTPSESDYPTTQYSPAIFISRCHSSACDNGKGASQND